MSDDVLTIAAILDHPNYAADLTLGALETLNDRLHLVGVQFHAGDDTPLGIGARSAHVRGGPSSIG